MGYQAAIELWVYEGQTIWARFNAMLVANSILIATIGISLSGEKPLILVGSISPIIGIMLCMIWMLVTSRGFDYYQYWIWSARELESHLRSNQPKTVDRGADFASGNSVHFYFNGQKQSHEMSWLSKKARARGLSHMITLVFFVIYIAMLLQVVQIWMSAE